MRIGETSYYNGYKMIMERDRWVSIYEPLGKNQNGEIYYSWVSSHDSVQSAQNTINQRSK